MARFMKFTYTVNGKQFTRQVSKEWVHKIMEQELAMQHKMQYEVLTRNLAEAKADFEKAKAQGRHERALACAAFYKQCKTRLADLS